MPCTYARCKQQKLVNKLRQVHLANASEALYELQRQRVCSCTLGMNRPPSGSTRMRKWQHSDAQVGAIG
jgi:hypothetical protein